MATFVSLVTCYSCNKTSRHSGVKRDFLAALSHNPNTPNSCGKRRDAARTPKSSGKGSVSHIKSGAKGKSPATTPRIQQLQQLLDDTTSDSKCSSSSSSDSGKHKKKKKKKEKKKKEKKKRKKKQKHKSSKSSNSSDSD
ncbi:UNVERIFIED_CONTAM: hypothetical protein FKN15_065035 [Acipenser sinensis]